MEREDFSKLITEQVNPATEDLDQISALELCTAMNREDQAAVAAVQKVLPQVAEAVEAAAEALLNGGRLIYVGAGTSGRIGWMDAAECPPTFGVSRDRVVALMAGSEEALETAVEAAEDHREAGADDLKNIRCSRQDFVVGLAASGRTPYVIGALEYAARCGCRTAAVACNPDSAIGRIAGIRIEPLCGPEALAGSTRLKAATAQKTICNMISTGAFSRCGKVYRNFMVDVKPANAKLQVRAVRILMQAADCTENEAEALLQEGGSVKTAIVMKKCGCSRKEAEAKLAEAGGRVRAAAASR
jgi:N-acetylmuramic acid 6-phosphate etherase